MRANGRPDVVGHVVGTDVDGHVRTDDGSRHDVQAATFAAAKYRIQHDDDDEQDAQSQANQFRVAFFLGFVQVVDVFEFHGVAAASAECDRTFCSGTRIVSD